MARRVWSLQAPSCERGGVRLAHRHLRDSISEVVKEYVRYWGGSDLPTPTREAVSIFTSYVSSRSVGNQGDYNDAQRRGRSVLHMTAGSLAPVPTLGCIFRDNETVCILVVPVGVGFYLTFAVVIGAHPRVLRHLQ